MVVVPYTSAGFFGIVMLLSGIILTVVTMSRMRSGKIILPRWGKVLLTIIMIAMLLILVLSMLPPDVIKVTNPFVEEYTHIVFPDASVNTDIPCS